MDVSDLLNDADDGSCDWEFDDDVANASDEEVGRLETDSCDESTDETPPAPEPSARRTGNAYVDDLIRESGLHILREREVDSAYKARQELGLFALFFTGDFRDALRGWTNEKLREKGKDQTTAVEFDAFLGLEIATSISPLTDLAEFWSSKPFLGQKDVAATMSRNRYQSIRARLQVHPPNSVSAERRAADPLWHSRVLMADIQKKFASIAVPVGAISLDENTVRTKARSAAKSYLPSKPDKYGVRFYAVVGWESLYVYSIWDNGSCNKLAASPAERYVDVFPDLRSPLLRTLSREDSSVKKKTPSALWVAMCGHMTKTYQAPTLRRLLVSDNFYTRHTLAKAILAFTDGEVHTLGTVRIPLQGKWNGAMLEAAKERFKRVERGMWELIAAVDVPADWEKQQKAHQNAQKRLPAHQQTEFVPPMMIAANAGYIVFQDRKTVVFYTNDLAGTPSQRVLTQDSEEAVRLCHGLVSIRRWTGEQNMHRKTFNVPAIIVAYNLFMNGVDRVDQLRSTNPIRRKEIRLPMSIFTWAIDMALINAFSLFKKVAGSASKRVSLREFKRRVAEQLTAVHRARMEKKRRRDPPAEALQEVVGSDTSVHAITPNSAKHSKGKLVCYLCTLRGLSKKSRYGCNRGFHVTCLRVRGRS